MRARDLLTGFEDFAGRPPSRAQQALTIVLGVLMTVWAWDRRGVVVGVVAACVYGLVFAVVSFRHTETLAWSRRHPVLDSLLFAPIVFLVVASLWDISLVACAAIGVAGWLVLLPFVLRRRQTEAEPPAIR